MHRISQDMMMGVAAVVTFVAVLYWLNTHSFVEQPHHYVMGLVIAGWIASIPLVETYRASRSLFHYLLFLSVCLGGGIGIWRFYLPS